MSKRLPALVAICILAKLVVACTMTPKLLPEHRVYLPLVMRNMRDVKGGISYPKEDLADRGQALSDIGAVATMDWGLGTTTGHDDIARAYGVEWLPMQYGCGVNTERLADYAREHPGSRWLILNEPDNAWQADCTPEKAAEAYRTASVAIRSADQTAKLYCCGTTTFPSHISYHRWWSEAYYGLYNEWPELDGFHLHSYAPGYHDRLNWQNRILALEYFRNWQQQQEWAKDKPVIISEWGVFGTAADIPFVANEYVPETIDFFEDTDWIELHL